MQLEPDPKFLLDKRANHLQMFLENRRSRSLNKLPLECGCYQLHGTLFHNGSNLGKASAEFSVDGSKHYETQRRLWRGVLRGEGLFLPGGPGPCRCEPLPRVVAGRTPDSTARPRYCK